MAGGRALVFDCWLTAKGISLPGVRTRAERQELTQGTIGLAHLTNAHNYSSRNVEIQQNLML